MIKWLVWFISFSSVGLVYASPYQSESVEFKSHSAILSGTLVFPVNQPINAAVVFVHGSGKQTRNIAIAEGFARDGIAALVYDKRGVGQSQGLYEERYSVGETNLKLLADDANAALSYLARHPELESLPLGLTGISQAGWIVPLAAEQAKNLSFMVIWSGPVSKVSEEDIYSKYTNDIDQDEVPSYAEAKDSRLLPYFWPSFLGEDTDPTTSLSKLEISGLWIFGKNDGSIPVDLSIARLKSLTDNGFDYQYILVPNAGHNNMRTTFAAATKWINALDRKPPFGTSQSPKKARDQT